MKQIITVSMSILAIFILTGCTSKVDEIKTSETKVFHHIDEKPFTIADIDALILGAETESQEDVTFKEEPIVVATPEPKVDVNKIEQEEVTFKEEPAVAAIPEPKVDVKKIEQEEVTFKEEPIVAATPEPKVDVKKIQTVKEPILNYYIQVSSFSKYGPSEKFLSSITTLGYTYKFQEVTKNSKITTKVLVGPFHNGTQAQDAGKILRAKVEPGSFLVKR